jgi:CRP-like cAMP-binding protein
MTAASLEDARALLARRGWLADCPADFAAALLAAGHLRRLGRGDTANRAGELEGGIWGVAAGWLVSSTGVAAPNISLTALFGPGEWGGAGPISGYPRQLDLEARTPATLLVVPEVALRRLLATRPLWWAEINRVNYLAGVKFGLLAADLQTVDPRPRVAAMLLSAAGMRLTGDAPVTLALSQADLGRMANLSHYPLGRIVRGFAAAGLVSLGYGRIGLVQPAPLRAVADGLG